jgi:hypothetical protein
MARRPNWSTSGSRRLPLARRRLESLRRYFADLPDPLVERTKRHLLVDILTIALCAVLTEADNFVEIDD